jgi:hypothetical protein
MLYLDLLFAEIPGRYAFQPDKGIEIQFQIVFTLKFKVRRLITFRSGLGNQDLLYVLGLEVGLMHPVFSHVLFG